MSIFKRHPDTNKFLLGDYSTKEIEFLKDCPWELTEKVDGTNIRVKYENGEVIYAGRSDEAQLPVNLIYRLDELFKYQEALQRLEGAFGISDKQVVLYGEGYGARIQKGGGNYKQDGVDFVLFDVCINGHWLDRAAVNGIAGSLGLQAVPVIGRVANLDEAIKLVEKGFNSAWGPFLAEGVVARPPVELCTHTGERIITKIKYKDFQL